MRLRVILLAVLGVAVLLVVGLGVAVATLDYNRFKAPIAAQLAQATGRAFALDGPVALTFWPRAALTIRDVTLANADWGSRPHMLKLASLSAEVKFWPLVLQRRLRVVRVLASDADLLLETSKEGRRNWDLASPDHPASVAPEVRPAGVPTGVSTGHGGLPEIGEIHLTNIALAWRNGRTGASSSGVLQQLVVTGAPDGRLAVRAAARFRDQAITMVATIDQPTGFLTPGGGFAASIDVRLPSAIATVSGRIADARAGRGLDVAVSLSAEPLAPLGRLFDLKLPAVKAQLSAQVVGDLSTNSQSGTLRAAGLKMQLGASDLSGVAELNLSGSRPRVTAELEATTLDLVEALTGRTAAPPAGSVPPPPVVAAANDGRLFGTEQLSLDGLRALDADITLRVASLRTPTLPIEQATLRVVLDDGDLALRPFAFTVAGSHVAGDARLNARAALPSVALDIAAQRVDLGILITHFTGRNLLAAKGDLVVALRGTGASPRALMAALDGNASLIVGPGTLSPTYLDTLGLAVLRTALPQLPRVLDARLNCAIARFDIARGLATARMLVMDAGDLAILGTGTVNLATETLALDLAPRLRIAGVAGVAVPVQVRGTLLEPVVSVVTGRALVGRNNPLAALGALVLDPGASRANPCGGLAEMPPTRAPLPAPSIGTPLRDLGGALRGLVR